MQSNDKQTAENQRGTERLYYHDSFVRSFDAEVVSCTAAGDRWNVLLNRTAFYPTSGGQPYDVGRLSGSGSADVLDVFEDSNEGIIHVTGQPLSIGPVRGEIDWNRRFDHMQQHTAQHLLSAAFIELFKFQTVSFHLGREISTIDIAAPSLVARHLAGAERRTNEIIFADRPINIRFMSAEQLDAEGVRKKVDREGILRVIDIQGVDRQPCGGSHLARTGQAGMLLIRKCERQKQNWRIEFVAGYRALAAATADHTLLLQSAEQIGCGPNDLPTMIGKLIEERRAEQRHSEELSEKLAELEADRLYTEAVSANSSNSAGRPVVIAQLIEHADAKYLRIVGNKLARKPNTVALLASPSGIFVLARSADVATDMGRMLREIVSPFGGKGGGSPSFAQGSVPAGSNVAEFLTRAAQRI